LDQDENRLYGKEVSQSITGQLAEYVASSKPEDIPANVRHEATRALVNWIGCPINGAGHDTVRRAFGAIDPFSGPREAVLLGRIERIDVLKAAFLNSVASSIADFDDTHLATIIHPTGPIASALLALLAIQRLTGREFLHSLLLGIEIECRLAVALAVPPARCSDAWFLTGLTGGVAAAMATGKALGLNVEQLIWAAGIAAARAAGTRETHGTMAKNLVPAFAAEAGLTAAFLAQKGFTASATPLEGPRGLAALYTEESNLPVLVSELGTNFELFQNSYKAFPAGIVTHAAITAALDLVGRTPLGVGSISKIDLIVHPLCLQLCGRRAPKNAVEGTFSVYHWVAIALNFRAIKIKYFSDALTVDSTVVGIREKVNAIADSNYRKDEAHIAITLTDGTVLEQHADYALGSVERPLSDGDLTAKLKDLSQDILTSDQATSLSHCCWNIEQESDAARILQFARAA
jgi:2-methylcitrate dehydratase PrpD